MSQFDELAELSPLAIWDGVNARTINGETCAMAVVELDPDAHVREHAHVHEQLGMVLRGTVRFRIGDEERELGPGAAWRIPSNVPHEVVAGPGGAEVLDVFAPARDDWDGLERSEPRTPRWP